MATRAADGRFIKKEQQSMAAKEKDEQGAPPAAEFSLTHHPDGSPKMLVIARENGSGQRRVSVEEYARKFARAEAGAWRIIETEAIAAHHSDDAF